MRRFTEAGGSLPASPAAVLARRFTRKLAVACLLSCACSSCTMAVRTFVHDPSGRPVPDAVVFAKPAGGAPMPPPGGRAEATVAVEGSAFTPRVLPVRVGTAVSFVNRDDITHQIYSISPAKNFERVAEPRSSSREVVFDRPGAVVLGLALRDRAAGHVYVLESPYFARTGPDGAARLTGLPRGDYELQVWHPQLKGSPGTTTRRISAASNSGGIAVTIPIQAGGPPEDPAPAAEPRAP